MMRLRCVVQSVLMATGLMLGTGAEPAAVSAQVSPADSAAVLLQAASEFEREGDWDVAEAIYIHITERFAGTPAAAVARARLSAPPSERIERISRMELPVFGTLYGLWLGVAVPAAFGADNSQAFGAGLLIGGPLGLFSARAATRARPLSAGQVRAITWGGTWGTWQGLGWGNVFDIGGDEYCDQYGCYDTGGEEEEVFAAMIIGGLAGIGAGAMIGRHPVRSGVASAAQGGSTWGSIYGAMIAGMFEPDGEEVLVTSLLLGNVGLLAGVGLARKYDMSRPRVRMINLGALVGGLSGLGIDLLVEPDEAPTALAIPLVTSIVGLAIAAGATRDSDRGLAEAGDEAGAALFGYRDGGFTLNTPIPLPTMLPVDDENGRTVWRPGLALELFRTRF